MTFADSPFGRTLEQTIGEPVKFVKADEPRDIVIFSDPRQVENGFDLSRPYIFIWGMNDGKEPQNLPDNVVALYAKESLLVPLIQTIAAINRRYGKAVAAEVQEEATVATKDDALRILVIDDTPKHIANAKKGLAGHHLTVATGYQMAMEILAKGSFDVVLTDLHLPMSSKTLGDSFRLGALVPYGLLLMVEAAMQGSKHVAVVTDLSHHADAFSAAFDHFSQRAIKIEGAKCQMLHAKVTAEGKDWAEALERLMK